MACVSLAQGELCRVSRVYVACLRAQKTILGIWNWESKVSAHDTVDPELVTGENTAPIVVIVIREVNQCENVECRSRMISRFIDPVNAAEIRASWYVSPGHTAVQIGPSKLSSSLTATGVTQVQALILRHLLHYSRLPHHVEYKTIWIRGST
jgi:hypothetical protein